MGGGGRGSEGNAAVPRGHPESAWGDGGHAARRPPPPLHLLCVPKKAVSVFEIIENILDQPIFTRAHALTIPPTHPRTASPYDHPPPPTPAPHRIASPYDHPPPPPLPSPPIAASIRSAPPEPPPSPPPSRPSRGWRVSTSSMPSREARRKRGGSDGSRGGHEGVMGVGRVLGGRMGGGRELAHVCARDARGLGWHRGEVGGRCGGGPARLH